MMPGPDQIIECPNCQVLASYPRLMSGNTFGGHIWSDGRHDMPGMPQVPAIVKCHQCAAFYWLEDAARIGLVYDIIEWADESQKHPPEWEEAVRVQQLSEEECYQALEQGLARNPEQEKHLRLCAWWRRNDPLRKSVPAYATLPRTPHPPDAPGRWSQNLEVLVQLLNEREETELLMKGEVMRELGAFAAAMELLSRVSAPELQRAVRLIYAFCKAQNAQVQELQLDY